MYYIGTYIYFKNGANEPQIHIVYYVTCFCTSLLIILSIVNRKNHTEQMSFQVQNCLFFIANACHLTGFKKIIVRYYIVYYDFMQIGRISHFPFYIVIHVPLPGL